MRPLKLVAFLAFVFASLGLLIWAFAPKARAAAPWTKSISADGVWTSVEKGSISAADARQLPASGSYQLFRLNTDALAGQLARAPMEGSGELRRSPAMLLLPMPDGSFQRFRIEESPVMEPSLAAQLPDVRTFRGQGIDDAAATVRFDSTPKGFHALILSAEHSVFIEPASRAETGTYVSHYSEKTPGGVFKCGVTEADVAEATARGLYSQGGKSAGVTPEVTNGTTLRTYRLAIAATGEWTTQYGGGTVGGAQSSIATMVNLIDAIYEKEVSIHFTLVNSPNIIFTNSATDPYPSPNNADSAALNANQTTLDDNARLGSANYDIGHLFGSGASFFSGLAQLGATCSAGNKARGVSTMTGGSITTSSFIGGIAHEIGHQFSATHTFNATSGAFCGPAREPTSAYEVGSGSTIMAYSVCEGENIQPGTDNYFHVRSLEQIVNFATNNALCATTAGTGNTAPTVTGPGNFTIPANTPFQLTASATDSNGPLTYSWEEYDLGTAGPPNTDDGSRPIFRGYPPMSTGTRYFPSLKYILNNANIPPTTYSGGCFDNSGNPIQCLTGESMPTTNRTLNFQVVVRDNQASGGAINTAASALTVVNTAGPFAVTAPNGGENWSGVRNVTWNVANTSAAPVSTANVKISLSTDGGQTFPTTLASSVPNNGTASITLPNGMISSSARVKVEAVGNIFFDVSNANFSFTPGDGCPAVSGFNPKAGGAGTVVTITGINFTGVNAVTFSNNVAAASFTVNNDTTITATVPNGASGGPITLTKPGCGTLQTTSFSICTGGPTALAIDDGSVESASSSGNGAYYVNRLTPSTYPATLTKVSIFWDPFQQFPAGTAINVVAGANSGGTANIDGVALQSFAATAGAQPGFTTYTLPNPVTINSGDFVVGFQVPTDPGFAIAIDTHNSAGRSYVSGNGTNFTNAGAGNYMIRAAEVLTGCSAGAPTVKILSITRAANGHILLQCLGAPSQVNNLQVSTTDPAPASFATISPAPAAADASGVFSYDDANAVGQPKRFYRVVYP